MHHNHHNHHTLWPSYWDSVTFKIVRKICVLLELKKYLFTPQHNHHLFFAAADATDFKKYGILADSFTLWIRNFYSVYCLYYTMYVTVCILCILYSVYCIILCLSCCVYIILCILYCVLKTLTFIILKCLQICTSPRWSPPHCEFTMHDCFWIWNKNL